MDWIKSRLEQLKLDSLWREAKVFAGEGFPTINLCSNDYLGLAKHPEVIEAAGIALVSYGASASSSRLVSGTLSVHQKLETALAKFKKSPRALSFGTGYLANLGLITSVVRRSDLLFCDRLIHASLVDGIALSRAKCHRYRHNSLEHLSDLLAKYSASRRSEQNFFIVTESVFSMDGDLAPLTGLAELAKKYNAILIVDEAHALGVFGDCGRGLVNELKIDDEIILSSATFSKAMGSYGGVVFCEEDICQLLVNIARPLIYNTALPPAQAGAALAAIDIIESSKNLGEELLKRARFFAKLLSNAGLNTMNCESQIVPVLVGDNEKTLRVASKLREEGIYLVAIRPPTVPHGQSRLRISVSLTHSYQQLEHAAIKLIKIATTEGLI
jgi:8-amino-7-oxononanoate synthase